MFRNFAAKSNILVCGNIISLEIKLRKGFRNNTVHSFMTMRSGLEKNSSLKG